MIFDTHAHYDDRKFDDDREELLSLIHIYFNIREWSPWFEFGFLFNNSFKNTEGIFGRYLFAHEITGVDDVAVDILFFHQFLKFLRGIGQRISTEWVCIRYNNQLVRVYARSKAFCGGTLCCQCCAHNRGQGRTF